MAAGRFTAAFLGRVTGRAACFHHNFVSIVKIVQAGGIRAESEEWNLTKSWVIIDYSGDQYGSCSCTDFKNISKYIYVYILLIYDF